MDIIQNIYEYMDYDMNDDIDLCHDINGSSDKSLSTTTKKKKFNTSNSNISNYNRIN